MIESLLLLLAPVNLPPPAAMDPWEKVRLQAVPLADAMGEFQRLCLGKPFDRAALDAAAAASPWNYRRIGNPRRPYADDWRATRADATFSSAGPLPVGYALPQCNFLAATPRRVDRPLVEAAVASALRQVGIGNAEVARSDGSTVWAWKVAGGLARLYLHGSGPSQQEVDLSLQFWTPEGLARAPAVARQLIREGKALPKPTTAKDE